MKTAIGSLCSRERGIKIASLSFDCYAAIPPVAEFGSSGEQETGGSLWIVARPLAAVDVLPASQAFRWSPGPNEQEQLRHTTPGAVASLAHGVDPT